MDNADGRDVKAPTVSDKNAARRRCCVVWSMGNTVPAFAFDTKEITETIAIAFGLGMIPCTSR